MFCSEEIAVTFVLNYNVFGDNSCLSFKRYNFILDSFHLILFQGKIFVRLRLALFCRGRVSRSRSAKRRFNYFYARFGIIEVDFEKCIRKPALVCTCCLLIPGIIFGSISAPLCVVLHCRHTLPAFLLL